MTDSAITVRPLETPEEIDRYFQLAAVEFQSRDAPEPAATAWRQSFERQPGFASDHWRGAFDDGGLRGGYLLYDRRLRLGSVHLRTLCIEGVVTAPEHRGRGVATALMHDAIAFAQTQRFALALLDGIENFYDRFGFVGVFDFTTHAIERTAALERGPSPFAVRAATNDDAPTLLALHERHYAPHSGSFERTLAWQQHLLSEYLPDNPPLLAVDADGEARGYLLLSGDRRPSSASEVAADDWPAALALAQHHARLVESNPNAPPAIRWPLSPDSDTFYLLADRLVMRSETYHSPSGGWMARVGHLTTLLQSLVPLWQDRWRRGARPWSGHVELQIDDRCIWLALDSKGLRLSEQPLQGAHSVRLSGAIFIRLAFGYRPVRWAAVQPDQLIPVELAPVLDLLFPSVELWIPGSDWF